MKDDLTDSQNEDLKDNLKVNLFGKVIFKVKEIFNYNNEEKVSALEEAKKEYEELKAKKEQLEKYNDELFELEDEIDDMDYCLIKANDLNSAVNCKRDNLSKKFYKYNNIDIESNAINALMFFDKESLAKIQEIMEKLNVDQLKLEKTYQLNKFTIDKICDLYISYEDNKYHIKNIEPLDKELYLSISQIKNKDEEYHLKNREIKDVFIKALSDAKHELNIASPWMNNYVVNEALINMMEELLKKGRTIKIIYGIEESSSFSNLKRESGRKNRNSDNIAEKLRTRFKGYGDKFKIKKVNSHNKLLICDESYYMETSFNLLSFSGEYDDNSKDVRDEGATYSTNIEVIKDLRNRYFNF